MSKTGFVKDYDFSFFLAVSDACGGTWFGLMSVFLQLFLCINFRILLMCHFQQNESTDIHR